MKKISGWLDGSIRNSRSYVVGYILGTILILISIYLLVDYNSYSINGVEKVGEIISVGSFSKGRNYIAKVKKDNSEVRFHSSYEFSIGENVYLLVRLEKPSEGMLGRKSSNLFTLLVYRTGSEVGAVFELILFISPILITPATAILHYIKHKRDTTH